jgi:hypothetical protein
MIMDKLVKQEFITRIAKEEFTRLAAEQIEILESKRGTLTAKHFNVDELIDDVRNRQMSVTQSNGGVMFSFQVLKKLRFADMKKLGNAKVYNRPLWGIIFGKRYSLMTRLQAEFTEKTGNAIKQNLSENLKENEVNLIL